MPRGNTIHDRAEGPVIGIVFLASYGGQDKLSPLLRGFLAFFCVPGKGDLMTCLDYAGGGTP